MPTLGDATRNLERRLFVGRDAHIDRFRSWLSSQPDAPEILNLSGYGGIGKSALLRVFTEIAREQGREVASLDARNFPATPTSFAEQFGSKSLVDAAARVSATAPLVILDTFEALGEMTAILQEQFLARLDTGVRLVISGRHPLIGPEWTAWGSVIRPMPLEALMDDEAREYLSRRGVQDPVLVEQLLGATRGLALGLVLGADLATQFSERHFEPAEWPLVVRRLVETLLRDIKEPDLRQVLEAAAVLHQFDQQALGTVSGRDDIGVAFEKLCRLSVVRPAEHGLMLHDEVRRFLRQDLRWRHPERDAELRERTMDYLRSRIASNDRDRPWLMREWFAMNFEAVGQPAEDYFSAGEEPGAISVQRHLPDAQIVLDILSAYRPQVPGPMAAPPPEEIDEHVVRGLLDYDGTEWRLARDREGRWLAYGFVLPVCQESLALLPADGLIAKLVASFFGREGLESLAERASETPAVYLSTVPMSGEGDALGALQELARDVMSDFLRWEVFLALTAAPGYKGGLDATRFSRVPGVRWPGPMGEPYEGFALDRRGVALERWLDAMRSSAPLPKAVTAAELEQLVRAALASWHDDSVLAAAEIGEALAVTDQGAGRVVAIREALEKALSTLPADGEEGLPRRAIELGYLDRKLTHERAAERLNVSRTTFFRLLKRGVAAIARELR